MELVDTRRQGNGLIKVGRRRRLIEDWRSGGGEVVMSGPVVVGET
jgi:hypothetical protein